MKQLARFPRAEKPRTENHYCGTCRQTQPFVDHGPRLNCPLCDRKLERVDCAVTRR